MTKVIIVDDDRTSSRLVKMLLDMDGFDVTVCHSIEDAQAAAAADVKAFVVDYHLGKANGLDLVRDIRSGQTNAPQDAIIVVTTGDYRRDDEAKRVGANRFLLKPYPPSTLSQAIQELLNQ